jgi:ATP-dependent Lhr-like helicase
MKTRENIISDWFAFKKWKLLPFQKEAIEKYNEGKSGLISVPTGAGKTFAAYLPALAKLHADPKKGMQILYITPLKALATDLEQALKEPIQDLELAYRVEKRTGDTTATQKAKQKKSPPEILLTTPESLALMLCDPEAGIKFNHLQTIIVDEWHELMGSKRGVLFELCLSKLKTFSPSIQIWGLTATIGNLQEAAQVCIGLDRTPTLVTAQMDREVIVKSILPETIEKLPWAGYLGIRMLPYVLKHLNPSHPTLIFTNTRSQAERWYQAILAEKPEWKDIFAIHHSSIDKKTRTSIEQGIKSGALRFVICTSSLDLGIDLPQVEKVIQIGSPKSVSRLIQRAGRSSHRPLTPCHIEIVPTFALELIELKGYRMALNEHAIERRLPLKKCYDVLLQHIMTCAIGGGFKKKDLFEEIKSTSCFEFLTEEEFEECLYFLVSGGRSLSAYQEYKKLIQKDDLYLIEDTAIIRRHKMNIGTITSDPFVPVKLLHGKPIGMVEESFISHLKTGDSFLFAGRHLKLVKYHDMVAHVRQSKEEKSTTAVWKGSRLPFSAPLGHILRKALEELPDSPLLEDILNLQNSISHVPKEHELLIEIFKTREGWHLFVYPFEGKTIHEGLALLVAHRLSKFMTATLTISCNDYGFEILSNKVFDELEITPSLFAVEKEAEEFEDLINFKEASKGCFRDIARIAGLVFQGFPSKHKSQRQMQMTTHLLFEVLQTYDPQNLLLKQAKQEVLEKYFENNRMHQVLERLSSSEFVVKKLEKFSPFSVPLFIETIMARVSTETIEERIKNIQKSWSN